MSVGTLSCIPDVPLFLRHYLSCFSLCNTPYVSHTSLLSEQDSLLSWGLCPYSSFGLEQ